MAQHAGQFAWYELLTTDPAAAAEFYTAIIGWQTKPWGDGYTMFLGPHGPLGGTMVLPEAAKAMGAPPHWTSYVEVDDADATVARARSLGGTIYVEPADLPNIGRFAVLADPQGASISILKSLEPTAPADPAPVGEFTWRELLTTDKEAAFRFYQSLFGWEHILDHDMGPMGTYTIYGKSGVRLGGFFNKPKDAPMRPSWVYYIEVDSLDARLEKAKARGGRLLNGPMEVPGGARIAQLLDPQGAMIALHELPPQAK